MSSSSEPTLWPDPSDAAAQARGGADDAWSTDGHGYSPHAFYVTSTDGRGRHAGIRVSIPPALASEMAHLVQSGKIPEYRTIQDIVRDSLTHRLTYVQRMLKDGRLRRVLTIEMRQAEIDRRMREAESLEKYLTTLDGLLKRASSLHDKQMLRELIEEHADEVDELREPYKTQAKRMIESHRTALEEE